MTTRYEDLISDEIKALRNRDTPISLEEYKAIRANSWEFAFIIPNLDNEAFLYVSQIYLNNVQPIEKPFGLPRHYDEACIHLMLPEALKRIEVFQKVFKELIDYHARVLDQLDDTIDPTRIP